MARYNIEQLKSAARGRWREIVSSVAGIPSATLDGKHHPCPQCGGRDRFRFSDQDGGGSIICNQCGKTGDGFATLQKFGGLDFPTACDRVAAILGVSPEKNGKHHGGKNGHAKQPPSDPAANLEFLPWDQFQVAKWCLKKKPIKPEAIQAIGGQVAKYRKQFLVIALPIRGKLGEAAPPVGWVLLNLTGGKLPCYRADADPTWEKMKTTAGSAPGYIGRLVDGKIKVKIEGAPDVLALLSCDDLPADVSVITNANGAKEDPARLGWMCNLFADSIAYVIPDADKPGIEGATEVKSGGRSRPGWGPAIARRATATRIVKLPYEISETAGKDLRDWLQEGGNWMALQSLPADELGATATKPIEADDDPHRLARANLERYAKFAGGATLRFWRDQWYTWKPSRGCYRQIREAELKAKINAAIKQEFDRLNVCRQDEGEDKKPEPAKKVGSGLVNNVMAATASLPGVLVPSSVEPMTWLGDSGDRTKRRYVAMRNGIIDIDSAIALACQSEAGGDVKDEDFNTCLQPHSPQWFSEVVLPYEFDPKKECPQWDSFLAKNLENDQDRIDLLQEWAGYLLLPDTGQQKFLVLEGEGANGKSVYFAAIQAMLGQENVSNITLEIFGERFPRTETLGKLANVAGDTGEIDRVAEGYLKSFTSGDAMFFDRKGLGGINCVPTARMMLGCNHRPRFTDRSQGIWRRMILIPFRVTIAESDQIPNMDKAWYWEQSGELPGIFNWALVGLARLQRQGRFTRSAVANEALQDYQTEMNPARQFLTEHIEASQSGAIRSTWLYQFYCRWIKENGYRPLGERQFFREVKRVFPESNRKNSGTRKNRFYVYEKINFSTEEICGESTDDMSLF